MTRRVPLILLLVSLAACSDSTPETAANKADTLSQDSSTVVADGKVGADTANDSLNASTMSAKDAASPDTSALSAKDSLAPVHIEMAHVNLHVEPGIVLQIARLRGIVRPAKRGVTPALDKKNSMIIAIASADIVVDTNTLTTLLNRHVFGYPKSPLKKLHVSLDSGQMVQTGVMHKGVNLPFRIKATMSVTPEGEIRVHPVSVKIFGMGVAGLTRRLGGLGNLITLEPGHGARLDHDDIILSVETMLPPPRIRGRLTSIEIVPGGLRQHFGRAGEATTDSTIGVTPLHRKGSEARNFMYFHGGTLTFGKLTMQRTDLEIVDENQANPFDYDLDRYLEHLVAGGSTTTPVGGLVVHMPDVESIGRGHARAPSGKP